MTLATVDQLQAPPIVHLHTEQQQQLLDKLARFQPEVTSFDRGAIQSTLDVDLSTPVFIETVDGGELGFSPPDWYENFGQADPPVVYTELSPVEKHAYLYGINTLRISGPVLVHLVKNKGLSIEAIEAKYGRPPANADLPCLISLGLQSSQGKTVLATVLRAYGETVVGMSGFSGDTVDKFSSLLGDNPSALTVPDIVDRIQAHVNLKDPNVPPVYNDWNAIKALDELAKVFENGARPEVVICDMPGYRPPEPGESGRMIGVFDIIGSQSMTRMLIGRFTPDLTIGTGPIDWRVISDYLVQYRTIKPYAMHLAYARQQLFSDIVNQSPRYQADYYAWQVAHESVNMVLETLNQRLDSQAVN